MDKQRAAKEAEEFFERALEKGLNPFTANVMEPYASMAGDVDSINSHVSMAIRNLIAQVKKDHFSRSQLVLGPPATGKTHLLARLREVEKNRIYFCFVEPIMGDGSNPFRHTLKRIAYDVFKTDDGSNRTHFHQMALSFIQKAPVDKAERRKVFTAFKDDDTQTFINLIRSNLNARNYDVSPWFVGLILKYCRSVLSDQKTSTLIELWIRGFSNVLLSSQHGQVFPHNLSMDEEIAKEFIHSLGVMSVFSKPILICFDQVETYLNNPTTLMAFIRLVEGIVNYMPNFIVVTTGLLSFDDRIRSPEFNPSTWDRFNSTENPLYIYPLKPEEGLKLIEARFKASAGDLLAQKINKMFPFSESDLDDIFDEEGSRIRIQQTARSILRRTASLFYKIVLKRPTSVDAIKYLRDNISMATGDRHDGVLSNPSEFERLDDYLDNQFQKILKQLAKDGLQPPDDMMSKEVVKTIVGKAIEEETDFDDMAFIKMSDGLCGDYSSNILVVDLEKKSTGSRYSIAVVFQDEHRLSVVRAYTRRIESALRGKQIDQAIYFKDDRIVPTVNCKKHLNEFQAKNAGKPRKLLIVNLKTDHITSLRLFNNLIKKAIGKDLNYSTHPNSCEKSVCADDVLKYLLDSGKIAASQVFKTIVSGVEDANDTRLKPEDIIPSIARVLTDDIPYITQDALTEKLNNEFEIDLSFNQELLKTSLKIMENKGFLDINKKEDGSIVILSRKLSIDQYSQVI